MELKEFKKRKKDLEKEILQSIIALEEESGCRCFDGGIYKEGARNQEGQYVVEPRVKLRFEV